MFTGMRQTMFLLLFTGNNDKIYCLVTPKRGGRTKSGEIWDTVVKRSMKKQYIGLILVLLVLFFAYSAYGETVSINASGVPNLALSVDPTERTEGFSAILYNNPNGLPTSEANAITETG